jgi:hypothetical protein
MQIVRKLVVMDADLNRRINVTSAACGMTAEDFMRAATASAIDDYACKDERVSDALRRWIGRPHAGLSG